MVKVLCTYMDHLHTVAFRISNINEYCISISFHNTNNVKGDIGMWYIGNVAAKSHTMNNKLFFWQRNAF